MCSVGCSDWMKATFFPGQAMGGVEPESAQKPQLSLPGAAQLIVQDSDIVIEVGIAQTIRGLLLQAF